MLILTRFPYDILQIIFDCLDIKTLLDAALTGHALNELASFSLYTSIVFNPDAMYGIWYSCTGKQKRRNPIDALERRPQLRKAVRSVTLCTSQSYGVEPQSEENAENCYRALILLPNVTFLQITGCSLPVEYELISKLLPQLRYLRTLRLRNIRSDPHQPEPATVPTDWIAPRIDIDLSRTISQIISKPHIAQRVRTMESTRFSYYGMNIMKLIDILPLFSGLTRLSLTKPFQLTPADICRVVLLVPGLQEATFLCNLYAGDATPTNAKSLKELRIEFSPQHNPKEADILRHLVDCIAGASRLERLDIITGNWKPKVLHGDSLLTQVLPVHGMTLRKLKIPAFRLSEAKLGQTLSMCSRLATLWIGVTPNLSTILPILLLKSASLEKLRLYTDGAWERAFAQSLLLQTCGSLRVLKLCANYGQREKYTWDSQWEYDDLLEKPVLLIRGPNVATFKGFTRRVQYVDNSNISASDEDADPPPVEESSSPTKASDE